MTMSEITNKDAFYAAFPPVSKAEWLEQIQQDLKGADFEEKLMWKTVEGFDVQPFYHPEDQEGKEAIQFSFKPGDWAMRQNYTINFAPEAAEKLEALQKQDFNQIGFVLEDVQAIHQLLPLAQGATAKGIGVILSAPEDRDGLVNALKAKITAGEWDGDNLFAIEADWASMMTSTKLSLIELSKHFSGKTFFIDGHRIHFRSLSAWQEVATILANIDEMLEETSSELSAREVFEHLTITVAVGPDYFMEMAKIRALRMLVANLFHLYDPEIKNPDQVYIHALNSEKHRNEEDPDRNLLQSTTEAMSALSAGVQSLSLDTQDQTKERSLVFFERITRNIQLLLKHESHFGKVQAPVAGAYYVEELTEQIARQAWESFKNAIA